MWTAALCDSLSFIKQCNIFIISHEVNELGVFGSVPGPAGNTIGSKTSMFTRYILRHGDMGTWELVAGTNNSFIRGRG